GSDPLYVRLCQAQSCFRARLTPKPWRCGMRPPSAPYPWENSRRESQFRSWLLKYETAIREYSVCKLIDHLGPAAVHPEIAPIVSLHDRIACGQGERPLA